MRTAASLAFVTVLASAAVAGLASPAHAESKAWTAIKGTLPSQMYVVAGGNATTIRKSTLYKQFALPLIQKEGDLKEGLATFKSVCKLDGLTAINDAVVAMTDEKKGVIVVSLTKGITEAKLTACLQKAAQKKDKLTITAQKTGNVVEYTATGENEKLYVAWLAPDVVGMATDPTDRALLDTFLNGKGVGGDLGTALGKVSTDSAIWGAMAKSTPLEGVGTMKALYGHVDTVKGKITAEAHIVTASAAEAKKAVDMAQAQLGQMPANVPAKLAAAIKATVITAEGAEVKVAAGMTEKDAIALINMMMKLRE